METKPKTAKQTAAATLDAIAQGHAAPKTPAQIRADMDELRYHRTHSPAYARTKTTTPKPTHTPELLTRLDDTHLYAPGGRIVAHLDEAECDRSRDESREIARRYNTQPALLAALDQISRYAGAALADGLTVKELQSILHTISTGAAKVAAATTKES
jgi:hypothetical protein